MILDVTAGYRCMWGKNRDDPNVIFIDQRREVKPTIIAIWAYLPIRSGIIDGAVKDPPHMLYVSKGKPMAFNFAERYGILNRETWEKDLAAGFEELMRVMAPGAQLLYKWNDNHITLKRLLACLPCKPDRKAAMVGSRGVRRPGSTEPRSRTWYLIWIKKIA
jgi:hypothetical protein